ncbi:hypothetical protein PMAYCL1PPCAC_21355, partial [Pristionchus mayeri]
MLQAPHGSVYFVFYAVEKGADNYDSKVYYVSSSSIPLNDASGNITYMSAAASVKTSIHFSQFTGFAEGDSLPYVYNTGADAVSYSRPVFTPISYDLLEGTSFTIYSPIATVYYDKRGGSKNGRITVTGDDATSPLSPGSSSVYTSPGYVGCPLVDTTYSTSTFNLGGIKADAYFTGSNLYEVRINGDYSIEQSADAVVLTVNTGVKKLYGSKQIARTYDSKTFNISIDWKISQDSYLQHRDA